jgi:hypothetical protein
MNNLELGKDLSKFSQVMFKIIFEFDSFVRGLLIETLFDEESVVESSSSVNSTSAEHDYVKSDYELHVEALYADLNKYFDFAKSLLDKFLLYQPGVYAVRDNRTILKRAHLQMKRDINDINNWQKDLSDLGVLDEDSYKLTIALFKSTIRQCREIYNTFNKVIERYNIDNPTDRLELLTLPNKP